MGPPGEDGNYGDGAAALAVGNESDGTVIAELIGQAGNHREFLDTWRNASEPFVQTYGGGFSVERGYLQPMTTAIQEAMKSAGADPKEVSKLVVSAPDAKSPGALAKKLKIDPAKAVDPLLSLFGDTGCAHAPLLLAAALEKSQPGDIIVAAAHGSGARALVFRVTDAIAKWKSPAPLSAFMESTRPVPSYTQFLSWRRVLPREEGSAAVSNVLLEQEFQTIFQLTGGKCAKCGTVQFPKQRVCIHCHEKDSQEALRLSRKGTIFTFTLDYLWQSPVTPTPMAVIDLEGGGRVYVQVTDCKPEEVSIGLPVEMVFRYMHSGEGHPNYFWKARPIK
jgi:uncharacterized OB-fold protein